MSFFKTPSFWFPKSDKDRKPLLETMLSPAAFLYQFIHRTNYHLHPPAKRPPYIICVGNAVAGGGGKTPVSISLMEIVKNNFSDKNAYFLSRGYGGTNNAPLQVNTDQDQPQIVGDEPLILARHGQTIISKNRRNGVQKIQDSHGDLIIMDDGLFNNSIFKNLSFLVIDGLTGFGNLKTIPAGPLREPLSLIFKKIDAVLLIGKDYTNALQYIPSGIPVFYGAIIPQFNPVSAQVYIGFAGIGWPEKFKLTLMDLGLHLKEFIAFPDHHTYSQSDIDKLRSLEKKHHAKLITTEKDWVRLPKELQSHIDYVPIKIKWDDEQSLINYLKMKIL